MAIVNTAVLNVSGTMFKSNIASFGGAVYIVSETDNHHKFSDCGFEENTAADGGAVYLNTGLAVDIFISSAFRHNSAGESVTTSTVCRKSSGVVKHC